MLEGLTVNVFALRHRKKEEEAFAQKQRMVQDMMIANEHQRELRMQREAREAAEVGPQHIYFPRTLGHYCSIQDELIIYVIYLLRKGSRTRPKWRSSAATRRPYTKNKWSWRRWTVKRPSKVC